MFKEFFEVMYELESEGIQALLDKDLTQARRVARKLSNYPDEQYTMKLRIKLMKLLEDGAYAGVKDLAYKILGYKWSDEIALFALRAENPRATSKCRVFEIEVHAGVSSYTPLGQFPSEYTVTFEVVAESKEAALQYIKSACGVISSGPLVTNRVKSAAGKFDGTEQQGVYSCSTFAPVQVVV